MTNTAVHAGAYLHHVAFQSSDPQRLARFYAEVMDMTLSHPASDEWRCEGPRRRMVVVPGQDKQLAYAGLALRDAQGLQMMRQRAEDEGLEILASPSPYFADGAFAVRDPNGQLICFGMALPETPGLTGIQGPTQHLTYASQDVQAFIDFYVGKLGFQLSDTVLHDDGRIATAFTTSNHEHHTIACFYTPDRNGVDHHSYEAGDWTYIRDWCDHFAAQGVQLSWGPGRHGPGNNLFIFITDPDGNWIEVSAEMEVIYDRDTIEWPQHPRTLNKWGQAILRS
ncbi:VOC family protein [Frigidibacter oleivorans]|uniref:VOC family protein n=1 Tax=Frigidibacter oleivorans TaxID=2487129 RepID=UPI000F8D177B|nr:VOC family protein [Frigidibacter oleivorans]